MELRKIGELDIFMKIMNNVFCLDDVRCMVNFKKKKLDSENEDKEVTLDDCALSYKIHENVNKNLLLKDRILQINNFKHYDINLNKFKIINTNKNLALIDFDNNFILIMGTKEEKIKLIDLGKDEEFIYDYIDDDKYSFLKSNIEYKLNGGIYEPLKVCNEISYHILKSEFGEMEYMKDYANNRKYIELRDQNIIIDISDRNLIFLERPIEQYEIGILINLLKDSGIKNPYLKRGRRIESRELYNSEYKFQRKIYKIFNNEKLIIKVMMYYDGSTKIVNYSNNTSHFCN